MAVKFLTAKVQSRDEYLDGVGQHCQMLAPPVDTSRVPLPRGTDVDGMRGPPSSVPSGIQSRPSRAERAVDCSDHEDRRSPAQAPSIALLDLYRDFTAALLVIATGVQ